MVQKLQNKTVLITGAGNGIGRAAALLFAREGARVVVATRTEENGRDTIERIKDQGGEALFVRTDVAEAQSVQEAVTRAVEAYGGLDILYNNAGGSLPEDSNVTDLSEDIWHKTISVNLFGTFLCCKYSIPELIRRGGGSVINTSSCVALSGTVGLDAYTAAKGGIISMTRSMALEFSPYNVRANVICPGVIQSDRLRSRMEEDPRVQELVDRLLVAPGEPEQIAEAALYLASDASRVVTGSVLPLDNGLSSH